MNIGISTRLHRLLPLLAGIAIVLSGQSASAATLSLSDTPLFLTTGAAPLNLLVMGRDHKLYYEAYNDHSDLDEDGVLDIRFKPAITYYGYFDSNTCYAHDGSKFNPAAVATTVGTDTHACSSQWSGNFLNYLTTSRMDALRKVLYGGYRSTDSNSVTLLERAYIPQDAHSWGKEYTSAAVDGYDISHYTPYSLPTSGKRHLFANVTRLNSVATGPLLRVLTNRTERIWEWTTTERVVAGYCLLTGQKSDGTNGCNSGATSVTPDDFVVRVSVCVAGYDQAQCKQYPNGNYKPVGLLQQYGENDTMKFGLLSGSYLHNTDGGVLRKAVSSIKNEINWSTDGTFISGANGILQTINNFKSTGFTTGYNYSYNNNCGWITSGAIADGQCQMWGNPIAEMMYEGLRYFSGKAAPTTAFKITAGAGEESGLSLPVATWDNPYSTNSACSKPVETVISDINNSYDTDKLPGVDSNFGSFSGDISGLNVSTLAQSIWNNEFGSGTTKNIFIGQSGALGTGPAASAPTVKTATSFGNIRGLAPEEPTKQGGYYAASVALYGHNTDLSIASGAQKASTFAVALASPLPRIDIPVNGRTITLIPFAKSVAGSGISASGSFQPTNQIVDFYVDTLTSTYGKFRVNYEDVEQGADHDMDAVVIYEYTVSGSTVAVTLTSQYAAGGIAQHAGYVISGTTRDGIYLDVRDIDTNGACGNGVNCPSGDVDYALDTPPAFTGTPPAPSSGTGKWNDGTALPLTNTRTFSPGSSSGAELLKAPLWYAAKYGGFEDSNASGMPDNTAEWDSDGDSDPDNYFLVTNALTLGAKLSAAFSEILARVGSASSATVNSGSISNNSRVYQAKFNSGDWTGHLLSYPVNLNGTLASTAEWDAADHVPAFGIRSIFTVGSESTFTPKAFTWTNINLDSTRKSQLASTDAEAQKILNYVRGDSSNEANAGGTYRIRPTLLGDIVNSAPLYVGAPAFRRSDTLESARYSTFAYNHRNRTNVVYAGANDGMLHAFNADNVGREIFAFIPSPVFSGLKNLTVTPYAHKYSVDGSPTTSDVFYGGQWHSVLVGGLSKGGQGIYALDITTPSTFSASDVLWEFTDANDSDLGYTYSQPAIARLKNGKWVAIFGNGYNNSTSDSHTSSSGHAVLYVVDISNGSLIKKIDTQIGTAATPNGLSTPAVVDKDGDQIADYVYAGDLLGNMWKFDISDNSPSNWSIPYTVSGNPAPLYVAKDSVGNAQPITLRPEVSGGPGGMGFAVFFGTGKWLEFVDKSSTATQTFYGIYDANTGSDNFTGRGSLNAQTILAQQTVTLTDGSTDEVRVTSTNSPGTKGWYMDLPQSGTNPAERVVAKPLLRNGRIIFTTLAPSVDPCSYGGDSWIMELEALTGSRLTTVSPFDVNGDGVINSADYVTVNIAGVPTAVPVSAVRLDVGISTEPGVLNIGAMDTLYSAGSSGEIDDTTTSGPQMGRQSWRQLR